MRMTPLCCKFSVVLLSAADGMAVCCIRSALALTVEMVLGLLTRHVSEKASIGKALSFVHFAEFIEIGIFPCFAVEGFV